ncbi:hypothetical protein KFL_003530060 [Klebsormidium nitens]|uniref:Uncharacterized protein n=1 Tax=Klebsormidium nitens TaxID=105231 RepID=A0A1Y1IBV1_KLENI|nr:hypothetical protein KFL_003530060 [Klebsormidium nitens]|eukprot:GAQ87442.1 hypothetical protein KFL_003530060 [Klebsormidium nitens]
METEAGGVPFTDTSTTGEKDGHPENTLLNIVTSTVVDTLNDGGSAATSTPLYSVSVLQELIRRIVKDNPGACKMLAEYEGLIGRDENARRSFLGEFAASCLHGSRNTYPKKEQDDPRRYLSVIKEIVENDPDYTKDTPHLMQFGLLALEARLDKTPEDPQVLSAPGVQKILELEDPDSDNEEEASQDSDEQEEKQKRSGIGACW